MVKTNIELYEALKPHVGDDGARLIAEVVPAADELATKADLIAQTNEIRLEFAEFKAEMRDWMLKFFVPLWIGVYGAIAAMVVTAIVRR